MKTPSTIMVRIVSFLLAQACLIATVSAQCNVNDKYDKIISGYHSSIALKDNGVYSVWGSSMQKTGAADQLAPQDINATNYTGLTGTIIKAALGGKSAGAAVDQGILLTSDGLWAWGVVGNVLKSTVKSAATFGRITSPSGATAMGLPSGLTPDSVASLFATYQTLVILSKAGNVYMLTQTTLAVEGNGGTASTVGTSTWQEVKTNASTYLSNIISVRGQVYNGSFNAFVALSGSGQLYTWGNSTYLGDALAIAARSYATLMTLPAAFASSIPKMIGVTGGGGSGATSVANTYYVLSNAGNIYSLGNNSQRQCGDFTTTERTSWVQVKKSAAANDYLTNINFFSCQEHNASFPAIVSITNNGGLYTWGNNSSGMCGRTDDNTPTGTLTTVSFDPGVPVGFSAVAISAEMGGHTMVYTKEGSTQFCYVGHYTNGSMGDGTSGNNGASAATVLKHDCSSTPNLSICGYVPIAASTVNSVISASQYSIQANGSSTTLLTIQLKDATNTNLTGSGGTISLSTSVGTVGTVTDNNNGTYTVVLTSAAAPGTATVHFSINGTTASNSINIVFSSMLPLNWGLVRAYHKSNSTIIEWSTKQEFNINHFNIEKSSNGADWTVAVSDIAALNLATEHFYTRTDPIGSAGKLFYRIAEIDKDGSRNYSPIVVLSADAISNSIVIYPVPVTLQFYLSNIKASEIARVELYSNAAVLARTWGSGQIAYNMEGLPGGEYIVKVTAKNGSQQFMRISKR